MSKHRLVTIVIKLKNKTKIIRFYVTIFFKIFIFYGVLVTLDEAGDVSIISLSVKGFLLASSIEDVNTAYYAPAEY